MKLYKIITLLLGKDLDEEAIVEYVVASNDNELFCYIDDNYAHWSDGFDMDDYDASTDVEKEFRRLVKRIKTNRGDFEEEYDGEFYDQKYKWEEVCEVTKDEAKILKKLKIIKGGE